ncbi:MAG TPA: hypothetical protein VF523_04700, partial [Burkholderiales bacterium]
MARILAPELSSARVGNLPYKRQRRSVKSPLPPVAHLGGHRSRVGDGIELSGGFCKLTIHQS